MRRLQNAAARDALPQTEKEKHILNSVRNALNDFEMCIRDSYRSVIPCSMAAGAFFMLAADILSRVINAPGEVPVGLVFAVIGVPFFIWTARKEERTFE